MADPKEVTQGLGDVIRQGLGMFGQGVSTIAEVLRSGDTAVREVDGALTGGRPKPSPASAQGPASEEEVARLVASLVRQGREEATHTGDPRAEGVTARFQEAMRLLFQLHLPADAGLSDIMPSPMEAVRTGLRHLRGSMALVRLANGAGTLADVEEVTRFAAEVMGRLERGARVAGPADSSEATAAAPAKPQSQSSRSRRRRKAAPDPSAAAFARAVAEEMGEPQVKRWAEEFAAGKIAESTWISRLTDHAAKTRENLDDVLERAQARMQGKSGG